MSIDAVWYVIVAVALTTGGILEKMKRKQVLFHQITGATMLALAIWVIIKQYQDYF